MPQAKHCTPPPPNTSADSGVKTQENTARQFLQEFTLLAVPLSVYRVLEVEAGKRGCAPGTLISLALDRYLTSKDE